jgi:hypothetical protein
MQSGLSIEEAALKRSEPRGLARVTLPLYLKECIAEAASPVNLNRLRAVENGLFLRRHAPHVCEAEEGELNGAPHTTHTGPDILSLSSFSEQLRQSHSALGLASPSHMGQTSGSIMSRRDLSIFWTPSGSMQATTQSIAQYGGKRKVFTLRRVSLS